MERPNKKPVTLTAVQKRNRLHFALANRKTDWSNVIFSSEMKFGKVGVWASIDHDGPCKMRFFSGRFSSEKYISILDECILPLHNRNPDMVFMQGKAHTSALVQAWKHNHPQVKILDFPMKNSDINPIHKLWDIFNDKLEYGPRNTDLMQQSIVDAWHHIKEADPEYFLEKYDGMKRVMEEVISMRGSFFI